MTGNEVEIRVTAKNDTKPGLASSKTDVERYSADFDRVITKSLKDGETGFESVTKKAEGLRTELTQMRADFAKTGNVGILGNIQRSEKDLKVLENALKEMAPEVTDFDRLITKSLQDGQTAFESTTKRAAELRAEMERMRADLAKTGNQGLFGDIKKSEQDLKFLEDAVKAMAPRVEQEFGKMGDKAGKTGGEHAGDSFIEGLPFGIGKGAIGIGKALITVIDKATEFVTKEAEVAGEKAGETFVAGMGSSTEAAAQDIPQLFTPEGAIGAAIIAALVVSLAPAAGAAIATAMTLGVGAGVIGVGAIIEHNNPQIVAKFGRLKDGIASELRGSAAPLEDEFLKALDKIDKWRMKEAPQLSALFKDAAPGVGILTDGILRFVSTVEPGIHRLSQTFTAFLEDPRAKGAWDMFASDVNAFFSTMGAHKQLIVDTFTSLMSVLAGVLGLVNMLVNAADLLDKAFRAVSAPLEGIYQHFAQIDSKSHWIKDQQDGAASLGTAVSGLVVDYDSLAKSLSKVKATADTVAGALTDKVLTGLMKSDLAVLHFDESLTHIRDTFKQNGKALDIMTAKGQANREAVLASVQANIDQYDAMIASGMSAKDAADSYNLNTTALEKQLKKAGLTKDAIDGLIGKYKNVPTKVNTVIAMEGLTKAIEDLNTTLELINGLSKTVTIHVHTVYGPGPSKPSAKATGGVAGGLTWIGEQGAELARLPQGTTVYPHGQSMAMAAQHGGGGNALKMTVEFTGNTDTAFASSFQNMVRTGKIQLKANGQTVKVG